MWGWLEISQKAWCLCDRNISKAPKSVRPYLNSPPPPIHKKTQCFQWNRSKYQYFSIYRYFREKIDIVSNLKFLISPITNQHKRRHISATPLFYIKTLLIRKLRHFIIQIVATPKTKINSSSTIVGFPGHFGISFQQTTKVTTCPYHFSSLLDIERIFLSG